MDLIARVAHHGAMRQAMMLLLCTVASAPAQMMPGSSPERIYEDCLKNMKAIFPRKNMVEYCSEIADRQRAAMRDQKFESPVKLSPEALAEISRQFGKGSAPAVPAAPVRTAPVRATAAPALRTSATAIPMAPADPPARVIELETLREVRAGWTRDQVMAKLGLPAQKSSIAGEEVIEKFFYQTAGGGRWLVRMVNGSVVASEAQ